MVWESRKTDEVMKMTTQTGAGRGSRDSGVPSTLGAMDEAARVYAVWHILSKLLQYCGTSDDLRGIHNPVP